MRSPAVEFDERLAARRTRLSEETRTRDRIGNARLVVFAGLAAACWIVWQDGVRPWWILPAAVVFVVLVGVGERTQRRMAMASRGVRCYEQALERLKHRHNERGEPGDRFLDPQHPYAVDLDLFGRHSLFQLLSICRTRAGEKKLAGWLLRPADVPELHDRHAAIQELREMLDLREDLAALGDDFRSGVNPDSLTAWGAAPSENVSGWVRPVALACAVAAFAALVGWVATEFQDPKLRLGILAIALVEAALFGRLRRKVLRILEGAELPGHDLPLLTGVLKRLEYQSFTCERLVRLQRELLGASKHIARLRVLVELAESRDNFFVRLLGPLVLWSTQTALAIENWHAAYGARVAAWLDSVAEFETLSSLAAYAYEREHDVFPVLLTGGPLFRAESLAHPLLANCVANDVDLGAKTRLLIVSGSNMSGKSTLLRTVGINCVLALAGAPVRARSLELSPLMLGASIRTSDSLEGGVSRFYAEILRLRQILALPEPTLFLLDELLAGTNSHDRRIGADALLKGLLARGAMGLATTHDLALAGIAQEASHAFNVHFEDYLEDGKIRFDYRMRAGVVERSNALELMRSIGLDV